MVEGDERLGRTKWYSDLWISYSNRNAVLIDNAADITNKSVPINKNGAIQLHARSNSVSGNCFERLSINGTTVYESASVTGKYVYLWSPLFYVKKEDSVVVTLEAPDKGERYLYFYGWGLWYKMPRRPFFSKISPIVNAIIQVCAENNLDYPTIFRNKHEHNTRISLCIMGMGNVWIIRRDICSGRCVFIEVISNDSTPFYSITI